MESVMENLNNLKVEVKDKVCVITINRPKALNALNSDTLRELSQVIDVVSENEYVYNFSYFSFWSTDICS